MGCGEHHSQHARDRRGQQAGGKVDAGGGRDAAARGGASGRQELEAGASISCVRASVRALSRSADRSAVARAAHRDSVPAPLEEGAAGNPRSARPAATAAADTPLGAAGAGEGTMDGGGGCCGARYGGAARGWQRALVCHCGDAARCARARRAPAPASRAARARQAASGSSAASGGSTTWTRPCVRASGRRRRLRRYSKRNHGWATSGRRLRSCFPAARRTR